MEELFSLETVLLAGGAVATAGFIKGLISVLKHTHVSVGTFIQKHALEPALAFVLSGAAVIAAVANQGGVANLGEGTLAVLAWYGIARLAMGIHDDLAGNPNSLTGVRLGSFDIPEETNDAPAREIIRVEDDGPTGPVV